MLDGGALGELAGLVDGRQALLLPVTADETLGFNAIPDAMAQVIGGRLGLARSFGEVVQTNKVGHTRAPAFQRIVTPARFAGNVVDGADYVLVDDHVGLGGTLADLRGHVETNGGHVIGMTTLTESRDARRISLSSELREALWSKHGDELDQVWRLLLGYGIDCLTAVETTVLHRQQSVAAIEDFLAQAAVEARGRGLSPAM